MDAIFPPSCLALGSGPDRQSVLLWVARSVPWVTDGGFHVRKRNPSMIDDPRDSLFDLSFLGLAFDFPLCLPFVFSSFVRCFGQCTSKLSSFLLLLLIYIVFKIPSCAGVALQCRESSCGDEWCISWRNLHSRRISVHSVTILTLSIRTMDNGQILFLHPLWCNIRSCRQLAKWFDAH